MIFLKEMRFLFVCFLLVSMVIAVPTSSMAEEEEIATAKGNDQEFVYSPAGRRDPFSPLVREIKNTKTVRKVNLGPLGKYELGQLKLMAMLVVQGTPRAMVKAPDGKSYTVKLGDLVGPNGGVVTRIETKQVEIDTITGQRVVKSPDRIVVEETGVESYTGKVIKEERYIEM